MLDITDWQSPRWNNHNWTLLACDSITKHRGKSVSRQFYQRTIGQTVLHITVQMLKKFFSVKTLWGHFLKFQLFLTAVSENSSSVYQ